MDAIGLPHRVLRVAGADAQGFLQNLLTNDLERLAAAPALYAGLLTPQGKVFADMLVWREGDGAFLLETPSAELFQRLAMYRLRAQLELSDLAGRLHPQFHFAAPPPGAALVAPDPRLPGYGWRSLAASAAAPDPRRMLAHRLEAGVPDLASDCAPGEVFALEALFEELNGVDFAKGCFVGQENVSRMKRRATTRRKFCRIDVDGAPAPGAAVEAGGTSVGEVRAALDGRELGLIRLDRALAAGEQGLMVAGRPARLDPPAWLILPQTDEA